jgi:RimJ/RimL family protein N-acetyltransferase
MTLPYFFDSLQIKRLYSEPYALNEAPNKTLERAGFELEKEYITTPGSLNFEQPVKRWVMTKERFAALY